MSSGRRSALRKNQSDASDDAVVVWEIPQPLSLLDKNDCEKALGSLLEAVRRHAYSEICLMLRMQDFDRYFQRNADVTPLEVAADGTVLSCATFDEFTEAVLHRPCKSVRGAIANALACVACDAASEGDEALRALVRGAPGLSAFESVLPWLHAAARAGDDTRRTRRTGAAVSTTTADYTWRLLSFDSAELRKRLASSADGPWARAAQNLRRYLHCVAIWQREHPTTSLRQVWRDTWTACSKPLLASQEQPEVDLEELVRNATTRPTKASKMKRKAQKKPKEKQKEKETDEKEAEAEEEQGEDRDEEEGEEEEDEEGEDNEEEEDGERSSRNEPLSNGTHLNV
jgi:hypothetical protein